MLYKLFIENSIDQLSKGKRKENVTPLLVAYGNFRRLYPWSNLMLRMRNAYMFTPTIILIRLDEELEAGVANFKKYEGKKKLREDQKPFIVLKGLVEMGEEGIGSALFRVYRVPTESGIRVELVAEALQPGDLVRYEIFPTETDTWKECEDLRLNYQVPIVPLHLVEQVVASRGMKWVHREPMVIPLGSGLQVLHEKEGSEDDEESEISEESEGEEGTSRNLGDEEEEEDESSSGEEERVFSTPSQPALKKKAPGSKVEIFDLESAGDSSDEERLDDKSPSRKRGRENERGVLGGSEEGLTGNTEGTNLQK
jgi:hypothetical protein